MYELCNSKCFWIGKNKKTTFVKLLWKQVLTLIAEEKNRRLKTAIFQYMCLRATLVFYPIVLKFCRAHFFKTAEKTRIHSDNYGKNKITFWNWTLVCIFRYTLTNISSRGPRLLCLTPPKMGKAFFAGTLQHLWTILTR